MIKWWSFILCKTLKMFWFYMTSVRNNIRESFIFTCSMSLVVHSRSSKIDLPFNYWPILKPNNVSPAHSEVPCLHTAVVNARPLYPPEIDIKSPSFTYNFSTSACEWSIKSLAAVFQFHLRWIIKSSHGFIWCSASPTSTVISWTEERQWKPGFGC